MAGGLAPQRDRGKRQRLIASQFKFTDHVEEAKAFFTVKARRAQAEPKDYRREEELGGARAYKKQSRAR